MAQLLRCSSYHTLQQYLFFTLLICFVVTAAPPDSVIAATLENDGGGSTGRFTASGGIPVTFQVNMKYTLLKSLWDINGTVALRSDYSGWNVIDTLSDPDNDSIYTKTFNISSIGNTIHYKFWINPPGDTTGYEGISSLSYVVPASEDTTPPHYFNNDSLYYDYTAIQFADSVLTFSSQYSTGDFSANKILGEPDVYPSYGDNGYAWTGSNPDDGRASIEIQLATPLPLYEIHVYETYAPGGVDKIQVKNPNTTGWETVWTGTASAVSTTSSRLLQATFPLTSYDVSQIRVELNIAAVPDFQEIDAVAALGINIPVVYTLTINTVGNGIVTKNPDQATYNDGDTVTLSATADTGWTFAGFSGDTTTSTTVIMDGDKNVTGTFTQDEYTLTVTTVGDGSVTKNPEQATYHYGDTVALSATADSGKHFVNWSGDITGSTTPYIVSVTGNMSITANFARSNPLAVHLISPANNTNDTLRADTLVALFEWSTSSDDDPDDLLTYIFSLRIQGTGIDTLLAVPLSDTSINIVEKITISLTADILCHWTVSVTDGIDTVASADTFALTFAKPNAVAWNNETPKQYALYQNYPNPFNPSTSLRFDLPMTGFTALNIYDMMGRLVATLVNTTMPPGRHEVAWDASGMPSGIYYYRISVEYDDNETGQQVYTDMKKLLLVK
ncbi:MAG: T9SS type A sorting domain-containing protein [Bacteroidetes bacterium]|nr:MAG: T9SS type A sorting domain-containing protein [Bacteroidota bacterium]